jgi:hypothetical protein
MSVGHSSNLTSSMLLWLIYFYIGSRKIDFHVLPILSAIYCTALVDRNNTASVNIAGMATDLKFAGTNHYSIILLIFFM